MIFIQSIKSVYTKDGQYPIGLFRRTLFRRTWRYCALFINKQNIKKVKILTFNNKQYNLVWDQHCM